MSQYELTTDFPCVNRVLECLNDYNNDTTNNENTKEDNLNQCLWVKARNAAGMGKDNQRCKWTKKEQQMWPKGRNGLDTTMKWTKISNKCLNRYSQCKRGTSQAECDYCIDKQLHDGWCSINEFVALKKYNVCEYQNDNPSQN